MNFKNCGDLFYKLLIKATLYTFLKIIIKIKIFKINNFFKKLPNTNIIRSYEIRYL